MGGGASQMTTSVEQLLTTTYMIGRAIAAISCPGMYRIYDFHSSLAPPLKACKNFSFFAPDESDDEPDSEENQPDPAQYSHIFHVKVGEDVIYIENPLEANDAGWTPLHACCMSFLTVQAGNEIIEEILCKNGSLETKTLCGPGNFNKGWTALHMACAYGVEPLVEKLIQSGADVNTTNCFGYTPLLEACHRGFVNIVAYLVRGGAHLNYIPSDEDSMCSPFISAPPQSPLGEAARCGFPRIVQSLIDGGAPKDLRNSIGWTALHEACFYNRAEVVKTLLLAGADATVRTRKGALPYHFAGIQVIRTMLGDMGGAEAVPGPGDAVDMVAVLEELAMCETTVVAGADGSLRVLKLESNSSSGRGDGDDHDAYALTTPTKGASSSSSSSSASRARGAGSSEKAQGSGNDDKDTEPLLLHSGPMLGDLPSLTGGKASPGKISDQSLKFALDEPERLSPSHGSSSSPLAGGPSRRADDKLKKKKKGNKFRDEVPKDIPPHFLCQLSQKPMSEPVKSTYGHAFEKAVIMNWLTTQGKICPLTGAPLSDIDLVPMDELGTEIRDWILARGKGQRNAPAPAPAPATVPTSPDSKAAATTPADDDLYDF